MIRLSNLETELNPFPLYREMRQNNPVYFDPQRHNWNLFRFADVQRALSDWETFSSQFAGDEDSGMVFASSMIATDPPRHRQLRALVSQAFTPRAVEALAPRIEQIVQEHLDRVMGQGHMDGISDLGYPLPVIVIAELLGIPTEDRDRFKHWSEVVVSFADVRGNIDPGQYTSPAIMEMSQYFFKMLEEREQQPQDDLISGLLAAEIDGEKLSLPDLLGFCALLLVAGNETTTNLIGNALLTFCERPAEWDRLRAERDLLPGAIEEVLRFRAPVQSMFRVTKTEVDLDGVTILAKAPIVAYIGSANHDENQFPSPEQFDPTRSPNRHLGFGNGIHYCLGAPLARLEARSALNAMLDRFKTLRLAPNARLQRMSSMLVYGLKSIPVEFERA